MALGSLAGVSEVPVVDEAVRPAHQNLRFAGWGEMRGKVVANELEAVVPVHMIFEVDIVSVLFEQDVTICT